MNNKPTILLVWGYHRSNWVFPFEQLKEFFDFHFLFYQSPDQEQQVYTTQNRVYYSDFNNVQELLTSINPSKVVFMSIDSALTLLINVEAKRRRIETIILQHGVFFSLEAYNKEEKLERQNLTSLKNGKPSFNKKASLDFLKKSLRIYNLDVVVFYILKKIYEKNYTFNEVLKRLRFQSRFPNRFLVIAKKVSRIFIERDGVSEEQLEEIGFYEFDELLKPAGPTEALDEYWLLVDHAVSAIEEYNTNGFGFTDDDVIAYHDKLAQFAENQGKKLVIKLHPYQFQKDVFKDSKNKLYFKEANLASLIQHSTMVIGFGSSLLIPAMYYNPVFILNFLHFSDFIQNLIKDELAVAVPFPNFEEKDFVVSKKLSQREKLKRIKAYIKYDDGKTLNRLKNILLEER